ncbi:hypothetical protein JGS39_24110 [Streptomyces sp. P01-B04]|uniref:hypothetical protein n=1 Tax=Streptomyces poriferorum TaxID=2798799 RepID=UPI001C5FD9B4|nr:hypothetical protein [Streptomyces poriferorum]MBW5252047.1 hypothetical protein [Streptomyces poriferorum]MBW5260217.1 hypothetical protein [Streptomyces poriferorum]
MVYSGNLVQQARYPTVALSVALSGDHAAGAEPDDADMFGGTAPAGPGPDYGSPGLWVAPETAAPASGMPMDPSSHWAYDAPALTPPRLGWVDAQYVARDQMLKSHGAVDASTVTSLPREPQFQFQGQGNIVNRQQGQTSWEPELSGPLARGPNSYAENNPSTEVYDGAGMRLGYDTLTWGEYSSPGPQQMQYQLRAVGAEEVNFPVDTPAIPNSAPYSGWGTGTQIQQSPYGSIPRLFAAPSTSAISDATMAEQQDAGGEFSSDGWG